MEQENRHIRCAVFVRLLAESAREAFSRILQDRFRSLLSLSGITIGVFSIVAALTAADALRKSVQAGLETVGTDVLRISRWPVLGEDEPEDFSGAAVFRWWKYAGRPEPSFEEYRFLKQHSRLGKDFCFISTICSTVSYKRKSICGATVGCIAGDFSSVARIRIHEGRYFTPDEQQQGIGVAVVGSRVAGELFGGRFPEGENIRVGNRRAAVTGVFSRQGAAPVHLFATDDLVLLPLRSGRELADLSENPSTIFVRPEAGVADEALAAELRALLRAFRRLSPQQEDDFSVGNMAEMTESVGEVFSLLRSVGWIIAGFSLLIGAFAVANILFFSVAERTGEIGIRKALGEPRNMVLAEFLLEAGMLSVAGGMLGLLSAWGCSAVAGALWELPMALSWADAGAGMGAALVSGLLAGWFPARRAARMDPVHAIGCRQWQ